MSIEMMLTAVITIVHFTLTVTILSFVYKRMDAKEAAQRARRMSAR